MTDDRSLERAARSWIDAGPAEAPVGPVEAALLLIQTTPQERDLRIPWRFPAVPSIARVAAVAAIGVLVVGGALLVGQSIQPPISPTPSPPSSGVATPLPTPTSSPLGSPQATPPRLGLIAYIVPGIPFTPPDVPTPPPPFHSSFTRDELWLASADGSGGRSLLPGFGRHQSAPVWSPDGSRLIFSDRPAATGGGDRMYWTDVSGAAPTLVDPACPEGCSNGDPWFFPGGRRLAFVRDGEILVMDLDGGRIDSLGVAGVRPRWSPDGRQMLFVRGVVDNRLGKDLVDIGFYIADADGTNPRRLNQPDLPGADAEWSPDGSRIVFHSDAVRVDSVMVGSRDVYTIRPDGTDLRRLTSDGISTGPTWSPDGRIRFIKDPEGGALEYWVMDADGTSVSRVDIPAALIGMIDLAWQP